MMHFKNRNATYKKSCSYPSTSSGRTGRELSAAFTAEFTEELFIPPFVLSLSKDTNIKLKKSKRGFTLMETMLAMVIIGIALTPIFVLHGTIMQRMHKSSKQFYALLWGKQLLYEARQKQEPAAREFTLDKKLEEHQAELKYILQSAVDPKSVLASNEGLHKEVVTISWTEQGKKQSEQLVSYVYKQPEHKKP